MSTNIDPRRDFTEADRQLVRPKVEFNALLRHAGATKDILSMREVMYFLGQYIMKKQLYDQTQQHIVHCSQDALGKVLGVESFSVKEPGPLFTMITKNLVPAGTREPPNAQHCHSQPARPPDGQPVRPPEVRIQESSLATQQSHSQPARPPDVQPVRPPEDCDADSNHSPSGSRRRRRSEAGPSQCDNEGGEEDDSDSERKRRRGDSYCLTFDNSRAWYVIEEVRNGGDRERHNSQSSVHSYVSNRSDRSDQFSVEFEVESIDSDEVADDTSTSLSDDDQVYEVTIYEDTDDTDEDGISEADYWRCLKCDELNPPLPRNCNRCWSLRQDWLREVFGDTNPPPSTNPTPLPPKPSPGPDKAESAEHPAVEEEGVDVPDGRRTTPVPPLETPSPCPSSQELSQNSIPSSCSQASAVSPPASENPSAPPAACASSSGHPAAGPSLASLGPCVICLSGPKDGCIVHGKTGHIMACYRCAKKLWRRNKMCPVCREPIQIVVKTFV